jgi:hypothetical protein
MKEADMHSGSPMPTSSCSRIRTDQVSLDGTQPDLTTGLPLSAGGVDGVSVHVVGGER